MTKPRRSRIVKFAHKFERMQKRRIKYLHSEHLILEAARNPAVKNRASQVHSLIATYDLLKFMQILTPKICNPADLRGFHSTDYVAQIKNCARPDVVTPSADHLETTETESDEDAELDNSNIAEEYGLGFDCPAWRGMKEYACTLAGATMTACDDLCKSTTTNDVIINWTGGWHHAQRDKAAGFCYINDIVLGILVLRKRFQRILYIDLDVHHGDGVQNAFEIAKRVFTLSFHQHECGFYPGTGDAHDCGFGSGRGYAANFPYKSGIGGENFCKYFKRVTTSIWERYQPDVCVIQCGADAIVGDPLGGTNLTPANLIECVRFVLKRNLPTLMLGGGGYNFANAARYWTSLTAAVCQQHLDEDIPDDNAHFLRYGPDYCLDIKAEKFVKDTNTPEYLEQCVTIIEENLKKYNVSAV